ncbi:MAG TPA: Ig-like domain-containing protein [Gaiellaceae bacterium]|nr:Ig-like domain-containing protein [Gaiellaceae bacterium]
MRVKLALRGLAALAVLALIVVALTSSASAGTPHERLITASKTLAHPGMGPAHWYGRHGHFGTWNKALIRHRLLVHPDGPLIDPGDLLQNPGNGEIMPTTNTHLIFWLPAGFHYNDSGGDAAYEAQMQKYFQDVGGSQILNTTTQYPGNNGTPSDTSTYVASLVDTTAFPHSGADVTNAVTQTDLNNEVFNDINAQGWNYGLSDMYFIFLPDNVVDCNDALTSCNTNKYCAYHTYGWKNGSDTPANDFVWADIPVNLGVHTSGGCGNSNVTGDSQADTTLSSVEHEMMEAITDPRLNAWQDSSGGAGENGDKCNRNMGVANSSSTTTNNFLGSGFGDFFRIQREWSNAAALATSAGNGCAASYTTTGSHVEVPAPGLGDVTNTVTESTIQGNNGDLLHYHVSFHNPSNQDDAFSVSATHNFPSGVSGPASSSLGDLAPHQSASANFTGTVSGGPLLAGTVLTENVTFGFDDSTATAAPTLLSGDATTTVVNTPPTLNLPGAQSQDYHDALSFGISASDPDSGDTETLTASGLPAGLHFTDNGDRTGTVSGTITATPGVYTATFAADDGHHLVPTTGTVQITVTREETTTAYTGPTVVAQGFPVTLTAQLLEDGTTAPVPSGQTVTLAIGAQTCPATVDAAGNAQCTVGPVTAPLGTSIPLTASFAGDTYYLPSSGASTAVVFAFPATGDFVLGDLSVAAAGPTTPLTWWGSEWPILNSLSGGPAPTAMKGYANNLTPSAPPACGGTWTTTGGNSPPPIVAAGIPSYMGVVVSSSVSKQGNVLLGNVTKIVVIKTNPGYDSNPGHPGTGTLVATYCG